MPRQLLRWAKTGRFMGENATIDRLTTRWQEKFHAKCVLLTRGGSHPWLPVNAASLLRVQLGVRLLSNLRNWPLETAFTGTGEAHLHKLSTLGFGFTFPPFCSSFLAHESDSSH